jgi:hypothetical protein
LDGDEDAGSAMYPGLTAFGRCGKQKQNDLNRFVAADRRTGGDTQRTHVRSFGCRRPSMPPSMRLTDAED